LEKNWKKNEFKLGINMAGAISAGAYTAGVLDFLAEALEEWQKAKDAFRQHLANPAAGAPYEFPVPLHDVTIEAFSGASAGGMCAAIASVMLQSEFQHITDPDATGTNNTFYEAWVNQIDIHKLLLARDLEGGQRLVSLLDSTVIDDIASAALVPRSPAISRPYVNPNLTLFLTTTNVRGLAYPLYGDADGSINEFTTFYGDRVRFETTRGSTRPISASAHALPVDQPADPAWPFLQTAAKATGAFPMFLAPRTLTRRLRDYEPPMWYPVGAKAPVPLPEPDLPTPKPDTIDTLNIDGGVTDNDPFELVHDYLASENPKAKMVDGELQNPRLPQEANCSVITVAPFPSEDRFDPNFFANPMTLFGMLGRLFSVMISQSRFLGESLSVLTSGHAFSRFVIAPSDPGEPAANALQCASLSAFGGFMERKFRAHDFILGRYNCQWFLKTHFKLPLINPVIAAGQAEAGEYAGAIAGEFVTGPPPHVPDMAPAASDPDGPSVVPLPKWMPVIPLVGAAAAIIGNPVRQKISKDDLNTIAGLVMKRVGAVKGPLLAGAPVAWLLKPLVSLACLFGKGKVVDALTSNLCPNVEGQTAADCPPKSR
jgi:hypothetical protein